MTAKEAEILIGIDPGVNTGVCIIRRGVPEMQIETRDIFGAMDMVLDCNRPTLFVRFEDARQRTFFGKSGPEKWQGAGSIKRDCQIWQTFFERHRIAFEAVAPKNNRTKLDAAFFQNLTGHTGRTTEHGRDAAMLIFGL